MSNNQKGIEAIKAYCNNKSEEMRGLTDLEYLFIRRNSYELDSWRFPENRKDFFSRIKQVLNLVMSQEYYGELNDDIVLFRAVRKEELDDYIKNGVITIRGPRSYCEDYCDAKEFAMSSDRYAILEVHIKNAKRFDVNKNVKVKYKDENETIIVGGKISKVKKIRRKRNI